ncbi:MAG: PAC2 family protein [Thermosphaera sp.]
MLARPRRTIDFNYMQIHEYYDAYATPTPKYMILCFPDAGLVSSIACRHLVIEKKLSLVGEVDSHVYLPPISVIHESSPISPVQMYMPEDRSFLLLLSEIPLQPASIHPFINSIHSYASDVGIEYMLAVTGLAVPNRLEIEKPQVFAVSSKNELYSLVKDTGVEELKEGFVVGPYGVLLKEGRRRGIPTMVLMVESFLDIPDPEAAALGIDVLGKLIGIQVDIHRLLEEAELIKLRTRDLMVQTKKAMIDMQKQMERQMPLMYM